MSETINALSDEAKLFELQCNVFHPNLREVRDGVMRAIYHPAGANVIIIIGPTGAGKSNLAKRLVKQIQRLEKPDLISDPGHIDVAMMDATPLLEGKFKWKDYFRRGNIVMREPLIDKKVCYDYDFPVFSSRELNSLAPLLHSLENALRYRKPRAMIIDEAHSIFAQDEEKTVRQLEIIKCMADRSGVPHVLIGTYSLGNALQLNGQLVRRCRIFEFRPYGLDDGAQFKKILEKFQEQLTIPASFKLADHLDYCLERSAGCVGIVRDWLVKAIDLAHYFNSAELKWKHLEVEAFTKSQINIVNEEIAVGRLKLAALLDEEDWRRRILSELEQERKERERKAKKRNLPIERKPKRDKVYVGDDEQLIIGVDVNSNQVPDDAA
jgi:energy-coupling factor transporter ATP-binding protein EcfA2